jgi:hypothetical protein
MEMNEDEMMFQEETNYSTRNQDGEIKYFQTIEEALEDFASYLGYRLSVIINGMSIHIHREELPDLPNAKPGSLAWENPTFVKRYQALLTIYPEGDN